MDIHLTIAAEDGNSSGWDFDLEDAAEKEIEDFIKKTVADYVWVLLDEIKKGNNSISILYGKMQEVEYGKD